MYAAAAAKQIYVTFTLSIHWLADKHLDDVWVLWITHQSTWEYRYIITIVISLSLWDIYISRSGTTGSYGFYFYFLKILHIFFFHSGWSSLHSYHVYKVCLFSAFSPVFIFISLIVILFRCKVTFHCGFDLHLPDD